MDSSRSPFSSARAACPGQIRTVGVSANNSRILVFRPGRPRSLADAPRDRCSPARKSPSARRCKPRTTETVAAGEQAYAANCAVCHGVTVVPGAGATAPDLRYSALLPFKAQFNGPVRAGERATRGMPGFGNTLDEETTDAILAYIIKRANDREGRPGSRRQRVEVGQAPASQARPATVRGSASCFSNPGQSSVPELRNHALFVQASRRSSTQLGARERRRGGLRESSTRASS